jgi:hypothetical protein
MFINLTDNLSVLGLDVINVISYSFVENCAVHFCLQKIKICNIHFRFFIEIVDRFTKDQKDIQQIVIWRYMTDKNFNLAISIVRMYFLILKQAIKIFERSSFKFFLNILRFSYLRPLHSILRDTTPKLTQSHLKRQV